MYTDGPNGKCYQLTHDSRGPLNNKQIRYSDVLLMYAEACCETGDLATAKYYLNKVRERVHLSDFPYTAKIQGNDVTWMPTSNRRLLRQRLRVQSSLRASTSYSLSHLRKSRFRALLRILIINNESYFKFKYETYNSFCLL